MSRRTSHESAKSTASNSGRKNKTKNNANLNVEFSWEKYLQQTGMKPAPSEYFKHSTNQNLVNKFEVGEKLEAKDARNPSAISVATIVQIQGLRLCLRLDGTDGCNDFWRLVDSKDIFPLGTCEAHGGLLQPPLGFTKNVSTWPLFLNKTLSNSNHANQSSFHPEPEGSDNNLFEVGMKLEAVDKKNPHLICPATIGDVDGDQVFISFDGWRGTFDYWTTFQSRDIFPVGWCSNNDHFIQQPGLKGDNPTISDKIHSAIQQQKRQTRSLRNSEPIIRTNEIKVPTKEKPQKRRKLEKILIVNKEEKPVIPPTKKSTPSAKLSNSTNSDSTSTDETDSSADEKTKKTDKNTSNTNTPSTTKHKKSNILKKDELIQKQTNEIEKRKQERNIRKQKRQKRRLLKALKRAVNIEDKLTSEQILMLTSPHKIPPEVIESELNKVKMKKKKKRRKNLEQAYTRLEGFGLKENNPTTPTTPNTEVPSSPSFLSPNTTPCSLFGVVREATQGWPLRLKVGSVVTSDNKLGNFNCLNSTQDKTSTSILKNNDEIKPTDPIAPSCVTTTTNPPQQNKDERATPSPSVTSTTNIEQTNYQSDNGAVSSTTNIDITSVLPNKQTTPDPLVTTPEVSSSRRSRNPLKWSIINTIEFVREKEPALQPYLHLFQKHEIDGAAFLLLSSNTIVKYMALKLGPALKLTNLVEDLKLYVDHHKQKHKKK